MSKIRLMISVLLLTFGSALHAQPDYSERPTLKEYRKQASLASGKDSISLTTPHIPSRSEVDVRHNPKGQLTSEETTAFDHIQRSHRYLDSGEILNAERECRIAVDLLEPTGGPGSIDLLSIRSLHGTLLFALGKYDESERSFRANLNALRDQGIQGDNEEVATALVNLASAISMQPGRLPEALQLAKLSVEMSVRLFPDKLHPSVAVSMDRLASILVRLGDTEEAETLRRESQRIYKTLDSTVSTVEELEVLNNQAVALYRRGEFKQAASMFEKSLDGCRSLFREKPHPLAAACKMNFGRLLIEDGNPARAIAHLSEALTDFQIIYSGGAHADIASCQLNIGIYYEYTDHPELATKCYQDALRILQVINPEGDQSTFFCHLALAKNLASRNLPELAIEHAKIAQYYFAVLNLPHDLQHESRLLGTLAICYKSSGDFRKELDCLMKDVRLTRELTENTIALRPTGETLNRLANMPLVLDALLSSEAIDQVSAAAVYSEAMHFKSTYPYTLKTKGIESLEMMRALDSESVLIDIFRHRDCRERFTAAPFSAVDDRYVAFIVSQQRVDRVDLGSAREIDIAVENWLHSIEGSHSDEPETAVRVHQILWSCLSSHIPPEARYLYMSPDSTTFRIPWGALPLGTNGDCLLDKYFVAVVPHASFFYTEVSRGRVSRTPKRGLVMGGVDYDRSADRNGGGDHTVRNPTWLPLSGAAHESVEISRIGEQIGVPVNLLTNDQATAAELSIRLPLANYAHIATHGFSLTLESSSGFAITENAFLESEYGERLGLLARNPLMSVGLVCAGANALSSRSSTCLYGHEVANLDLSNLELAVLSACETRLGDTPTRSGSFALAHAFHLAGTRNVAASLWKVSDSATAALMIEFHKNMWERKRPPLEALVEAQRTLRNSSNMVRSTEAQQLRTFTEVEGVPGATVSERTADTALSTSEWAGFILSGVGR